MLKYLILTLALSGLLPSNSLSAQPNPPSAAPSVKYGENAERGRFLNVNGISLYLEDYGAGQTVLQIHGNNQSIASMARQLDALSQHYRVIAVDSRGHGKSGIGVEPLTYEQMADDFNVVLDQLNLKSVYVLGVSDGGIIGLLLAIKYPDKVAKLAIMGASLNPSGAYDWAMVGATREREKIDSMISKGDTSRRWIQARQLLDLLIYQPNITPADLGRISAPTLVMAGDRDIIRIEHTVQIFQNISNSHLAIFPGSTHFVPNSNSQLFNATVLSFFQRQFKRPDSRDYLK